MNSETGKGRRGEGANRQRVWPVLVLIPFLIGLAGICRAGQTEPPPDPGFEASVQAADAIVDAEIVAGGPFRAVAIARKVIHGNVPNVFELEGYNSYNWDTVHQGFAAGTRFILFLSTTQKPDVFSTLTPAAPRLSVQQDGILFSIGDPPFRVPVKRAALEEALALLLEANATGKVPDRAEAFVRGLWEGGDIEPRYLAVFLAGSLRDTRCAPLLIEASKGTLLKMRLTAIEALGKVNTPEAIIALRGLLKDEKTTVAREAAKALAASRDVESLTDLLEWVRKSTDALSKGTGIGGGKADPNKAKIETTSVEILKLAGEIGPLLEPDALARPLFELAKSRNETVAREALLALGLIAQAPQVASLLEIADDRLSDMRDTAAMVLQRVTLTNFNNIDEFRAWWSQNSKTFHEDAKRDRVEAAAKKLAKPEENIDRRALLEAMRNAPGGIALISAAPLLLKAETATLFGSDDLSAWNSPLALPFFLERLGRVSTNERRDALSGLVRLCAANPRLKTVFWPLIRAELADEDNACRRAAQAACSKLAQADSAGPLLDAIQYSTGYEAQEASKGLYKLSARTLGFATTEPQPDEYAARQRLRGWWETAQKNSKPLNAGGTPLPRVWLDLEPAARAAKLDALVLSPESRRSSAAFTLAFAERPASDGLWKKLLAQGRQRDRANGIVGLLGGDASIAPELVKRLTATGDATEPPLCRALELITLATLETNGKNAGAEKVVEWLRGPGKDAEMPWRRMGIVSLGLADRDAASLAYLESVVKAGLADTEPSTDTFLSEEPTSDYALIPSALVALSARSDGTPLLMKILEESANRHTREWAARALTLRRHEGAVAGIVKALEKADRYDWQDLCRMLDALVKPSDTAAANLIGGLLDSTSVAPRNAAAFFFAQRPDVGADADTRGHLVTGLSDRTNLVRYYCAEGLGKRRSTSAINRLVELLTDDDDDVRSAAAEALGRIGDRDSCGLAADAAEMQMRLDVRWLKAMALTGKHAHLALLLKLVGSSSYVEQRAGLEAMGYSDLPLAMQTLLKTYRNDEAALQTIGAEALAQRANAAVNALREDLNGADKNAKARALHLLSRINTPASRTELEKARDDADSSIKALAEFGLKRLDSIAK